jgi:hypothetical protein
MVTFLLQLARMKHMDVIARSNVQPDHAKIETHFAILEQGNVKVYVKMDGLVLIVLKLM